MTEREVPEGSTATTIEPGDRLIVHLSSRDVPDIESLARMATEVKRLSRDGGVLVTAPDVQVFVARVGTELNIAVCEPDDDDDDGDGDGG